MKILTLNTWTTRGPWRERWELILEGIKEYSPDVIGFQEVFCIEWVREIQRRAGYQFLVEEGNETGNIFLSKFRPVEQARLKMKTKSPSEDYFRYVLFTLIDFGRREISFFNTHLSWKSDEGEIRKKQIDELKGFIKEREGKFLSIVLGDFNAAPDTPEITGLREKEKWIDVFAEINPGVEGLTWDYKNQFAYLAKDKMAERRIDYIFIKKSKGIKLGIKSAELVFDKPSKENIFASDHFGVLTELEFE